MPRIVYVCLAASALAAAALFVVPAGGEQAQPLSLPAEAGPASSVAPPTTTTPATVSTPATGPAPTTTRLARLPKPVTSDKTQRTPPRAGSCAGWEGLIAQHFPAAQVPTACKIAMCESGGNPNAQNRSSSAAGLFQLVRAHAGRFERHGWSWADRYDPAKNTAVAADLWREQSWRPWSCKG